MANMEQYNKEKQELIEARRKKAGIDAANVEEAHTFVGTKNGGKRRFLIFGITINWSYSPCCLSQ